MKLSRTNETLALLGNVGVIVGIIFLIVEVRQNTIATDNETAWARTATSIELNALIISDLDRAARSAAQSDWSVEQIQNYQISNPAEATQDSYYYRSRLLLWQTRYLTQPEPELRATLRDQIRTGLSDNDTMRYVVESERTMTQVYPDFREFLLSILHEIDDENPN